MRYHLRVISQYEGRWRLDSLHCLGTSGKRWFKQGSYPMLQVKRLQEFGYRIIPFSSRPDRSAYTLFTRRDDTRCGEIHSFQYQACEFGISILILFVMLPGSSLPLLISKSGSMLDYRKFISCERWSRGKHVKFKNRILIAGPVCKVDCHGMLYICSNSRLKRYTNPSPEAHRGSPVPR